MATTASAQTNSISLTDAVRAAESHPDVAAAQADVNAAEARRKQARSSFGPTLAASASLQVWNDDITASFGGAGGDAPMLPPPTTPYEEIVAGIAGSSSEITIREQVTWDTSVTLTQPITPLWTVYLGHEAAQIGESVAKSTVDQAHRDRGKDAAVTYFQALQAAAQLDTANQSVAQLEAQQERLADLVELGSVQPGEKLRIDVAVAAARQDVLRAEADLELARSSLAVAIGRDPTTAVTPDPIDAQKVPPIDASLEQWLTTARSERPELRQLRLQDEQVELNERVATAAYIPQLVALAQYSHTAGQGLTGSDTFFVGAALDWTIWEWGKKSYAVDEAEAQRVKLSAAQIQAERQITLQVKSAWLGARASRSALDVASAATRQAEEAYQVAEARFEAGASTPTDLLDAQAALTQARNNESAALYEALIRRAELVHAAGQELDEQTILDGGTR